MSQAIPDKYKDLFQKRAFASLGTLMPDGRPQVHMCRVRVLVDLVPRWGLDLLRGFSTGVGQREELFTAFALLADNQSFVDQQLQGRVDRAGAGPPQVLAALGNLLDDLVAVHRPLGEQHQDGGTDVSTAAAPAMATAPSTARARAEAARTEATGTEAAPETPAEAGPERPVVADVVALDIVTELAAGLPALLV